LTDKKNVYELPNEPEKGNTKRNFI